MKNIAQVQRQDAHEHYEKHCCKHKDATSLNTLKNIV